MATRTLTSASLMLMLTASFVTAQSPAPAQARPPQTYPAFLQAQYATIKRYIIGSAEKMPAEHFAFKPAPEVMTYAGLLGHIIDVQYRLLPRGQGRRQPGRRQGARQTRRQTGAGARGQRGLRLL